MSQQAGRTPAENAAVAYEEFLVPALFRPWTAVLLERAMPRPGERVLDVATGTGIVARTVAPQVGPTGRVVGLDVNPAMLGVARSLPALEGAPIAWEEASAVSLPFSDGAFDLVLCQQGLQFFPDRAAATREMRRVLTEDGRAVVAVWRSLADNPFFAALNAAAERCVGAPVLAGPFSLGEAEALRELLTEAGFRHVAIEPVELTVRFPDPERFLRMQILAAAAVLPELAAMDEAARAALVDAIRRDVDDLLRAHTEDGLLAVRPAANIAVAHA